MRFGEIIFLILFKVGFKYFFLDFINKYLFYRLLKRDLMKEKIKIFNIYLLYDKIGLFFCNNY